MLLSGGCEGKITIIGLTSANLTLTVEDIAVTEVSLRMRVDNPREGISFRLLRNDSTIYNEPLINSDTRLYDKGLLPEHTYHYRVSLFKDGILLAQSAEQAVTTMDTTAHNFVWETYTIESPYGSALLQDVVIIDENDIWAVGTIAADSILTYNALHFDGNVWEMKRIYYNYHGHLVVTSIDWIFAFNKNDIWFGNSMHWNGVRFNNADIAIDIFTGIGINKMWGNPGGEFYLVGNQGTIAYSSNSGVSWQKLMSGIDTRMQDIWGSTDLNTGQEIVLCLASDNYSRDSSTVLQISDNNVIKVQSSGLPSLGWFRGIWSGNGREWYVCGDGLYRTRDLNLPWEEVTGLPSIFMNDVQGNKRNDLFVTGYLGLIAHWNGATWRVYPPMPGNYYGLAVKDDLVVAVGQELRGIVGGPASILIGRRN
jgi:hypothetical protein